MRGPKHASSSVLAAAREIFDGCSDGLVGLHQVFFPPSQSSSSLGPARLVAESWGFFPLYMSCSKARYSICSKPLI